MEGYRPDRVVRGLTAVVSIAYFALFAVGVLALLAAPGARLLAAGHDNWVWGLDVPAATADTTSVLTAWGGARLVVDGAPAVLELPIAMLPWWLVGVLWVHAAVAIGLTLLAVHHLRRIFQRVRDGAPFDAQNALRMRWLGLLLLALSLFEGLGRSLTALAVRGRLVGEEIAVSVAPRIDPTTIFVALVLVALAEIFRRGAELEDEQSLVV